jgi:hypothetical protein
MAAKITLITPPDIFQNDVESVLFFDITEKEQDAVTQWLSTVDDLTINIYFYQGEPNVPWFLHALSCSNYKYVNLNNMSAVTGYLAGYILSKQGVFYSTSDVNVAELFSHINHNRVNDAVDFLKRVFSGKR